MDILDIKGRIFDIQKFSIHDGIGIRTIVFLKGCPLRCKWCCNPESQSREVQTRMVGGVPKIMGRDVTVGEVMEVVAQDRPYYYRSGGGMTLSGGECFAQPDFALALLEAAKEHYGINTAVETTLFTDFERVEQFMPYVDMFMVDVKMMNSEKHKYWTGQPNERILENIRRLDERGANIIIRTPVIPTVNDSRADITAIGEFVKSLKNTNKWHLLPYHRLGEDKYEGLGMKYELSHLTPPTPKDTERILEYANSVGGLNCQIGG